MKKQWIVFTFDSYGHPDLGRIIDDNLDQKYMDFFKYKIYKLFD